MTRVGWVSDRRNREDWIQLIGSLGPEIDPRALRLMDEMRQVAHALYQIGEDSMSAAGLSYAKFRLLMGLLFTEQLEGREELNPSEISKREGTSRNTISALIRDLEEEGLIARQLDQNDRRKFKIRLTEEGRRLVRENASRHFQAVASCFGELEPLEMEELSRLLAKLRDRAYSSIGGAKTS